MGGGGTLKNFVCGYACWTLKFWLSLYLILSPFTTHQYTNFVQKHPILLKFGAFYHHLLKINPIYVNWVPSSMMKTPPISIPKSAKKHPKRHVHISIPCQCDYPHPPCRVPIRVGVCDKWQRETLPSSVPLKSNLDLHQIAPPACLLIKLFWNI